MVTVDAPEGLAPEDRALVDALAACAEGVREVLQLVAALHDRPAGFSFVLAVVHNGQPKGDERCHLLGGGLGSNIDAMNALLAIVGRGIGNALDIYDRGDKPTN